VLFDLGVQSGGSALERFVDVVSTNPAKIMGLWPKKGQLQSGATPTSLSSIRTRSGRFVGKTST
jgi:dihydropyrimidinase